MSSGKASKAPTKPVPIRGRATDIDRHIGAMIHHHRIVLGLSQQHIADMIGVSWQQTHKYERGISRITTDRLLTIAQALGVEIGFFLENVEAGRSAQLEDQERTLANLIRNFAGIRNPEHQEALCQFVRDLAASGATFEPGPGHVSPAAA